jgi:hypothetical protein
MKKNEGPDPTTGITEHIQEAVVRIDKCRSKKMVGHDRGHLSGSAVKGESGRGAFGGGPARKGSCCLFSQMV